MNCYEMRDSKSGDYAHALTLLNAERVWDSRARYAASYILDERAHIRPSLVEETLPFCPPQGIGGSSSWHRTGGALEHGSIRHVGWTFQIKLLIGSLVVPA